MAAQKIQHKFTSMQISYGIQFQLDEIWQEVATYRIGVRRALKFPGRDGSWMGGYATCGSCHLAHAA